MAAPLQAEVQAPVFAPSSADSPVALQVTISCATQDSEIHYTLNGEEPTRFDPAVASGGSLTIPRSALLKAKAWLGEESGPTASEDYRITGAISCGYQHGLALSVAGRIWSWGEQGGGRLGNGSTAGADIATPARVLLGGGYFDNGMVIAAGYDHTQVIDKNGLVWSFGENGDGQLGNNSTTDSALPVRVLQSATAGDYLGTCLGADAGQEFSVALLPTGVPVTWGSQATGRLGNGTNSTTPRKFAGAVVRGDDPSYPQLSGIRQVSAGHSHGLAREANSSELSGGAGRVWVWGHNHVGQLGRGDTSGASRAMPMLLDANTELTDALDISGGGAHVALVRWSAAGADFDGTVWCCGSQAEGRLGNGTTASGSVTYPVKVLKEGGVALTGVRQVSAGPSHTLAVDEDGHVWAWGNNQYGQLGDGTTTHNGHARMVKDAAGTGVLGGIVMVSAGGESTNGRSMALAADGTIWVWGRNNEGQLGNGQTAAVTALPVAHAQNHVDEGEPAVSLSYSINGLSEPYGATLEALPTHSGPEGLGHLTSIKFYVDGGLAATVASAPWTTALADLPPGQHHAFALATDENGVTAMSQSVTFDASDPDGDGLPSAWETQHSLDPEDPADVTADPDQDQLNNSQEFHYSTNPRDKDTDDDYVPDGIEVFGP